MFQNIGFPELILILVVALVFFGPKKLPELGRSLGTGLREFKKAVSSARDEAAKAAEATEPDQTASPHQASPGGAARPENQ